MSSQEEVLKIGKKLTKIISNDNSDSSSTVDLLKALKNLPITLEVLKKTKIGVTVNDLRKVCKDEETTSLCKSVIKSWKKLVPETGGSSGSAKSHSGGSSRKESGDKESSHKESSSRKESSHSSSHKESGHKGSGHHHNSEGSSSKSSTGDNPARRCGSGSTLARSTSAASASSTRSDESSKSIIERSDSMQSTDSGPTQLHTSVSVEEQDPECQEEKQSESCTEDSGLPLSPTAPLPRVEVDETTDPVRIKCREMLAAALNNPPIEGFGDGEIIAAEIEHFVFKHFENTDAKYRNRIRSRITNLKDSRNPLLRQQIIFGHISPKQFSMMSPEEMASDEMKKLREKLAKEAFNDHQMSTNSGTKSDLFKCGRCGKRNTTYNQLQTRSSDEPMTTFVFCNECGNRWKFC